MSPPPDVGLVSLIPPQHLECDLTPPVNRWAPHGRPLTRHDAKLNQTLNKLFTAWSWSCYWWWRRRWAAFGLRPCRLR